MGGLCPSPVFPLPAVSCFLGGFYVCRFPDACAHWQSSLHLSSPYLISFLSDLPQLLIPVGKKCEVGYRDEGEQNHDASALPLRSEASPRPLPRTAVRWGTSSPSASMPSTPSWTPGSSSFSERLSSNASSSGSVVYVLVLSVGTYRQPFPGPHRGEETHWLPLLSRLRKGTGCP